MSFLEDTKSEMKDCKKSVSDIQFIGSSDGQYEMSWEEFTNLAKDFILNGSLDGNPPKDLIIIFKDTSRFYLVYDQCEISLWKYMPVFKRSENPKPIRSFKTWELVKELWRELR